jgi:hypothetical protein
VQSWGQVTQRGNKLYLHVLDWPADGKLHVAGLRSPIFNARLLGRPGTAPLAVTRLGETDYRLALPSSPTDPWDSVIELECGVPMETAEGIWLRPFGAPVPLHVFDGRIAGTGIGYGDGKRGRDVVLGWSDTASTIAWTVRVTEPARYFLALEYASAPKDSAGDYEVVVAGQRHRATVQPTTSDTDFKSHDVGAVTLTTGVHTITVRPLRIVHGDLMRLRHLILVPSSSTP